MADANTSPSDRTILAFDFGQKRIGIAVAHQQTGIASPLTTLTAINDQPDWDSINKLIMEWRPDALVIGVPYHMDGSDQEMTEHARRFGRQLHGRYNLPVHEVDERLTSSEAASEHAQQRAAGRRRKTQKGDLDKLAASLILETWLQQQESQSGG